jgi:hypothetical protein
MHRRLLFSSSDSISLRRTHVHTFVAYKCPLPPAVDLSRICCWSERLRQNLNWQPTILSMKELIMTEGREIVKSFTSSMYKYM